MIDTPFAIICTSSAADLSAAVTLAAAARAAGAIVETPLAHSPVERQIRRAHGSNPPHVLVVKGNAVDMLYTRNGMTVSNVSFDQASALLAEIYQQTNIIPMTFAQPQQGLPKAA